MSYNGSGTFLINTAGQPVVSGTVISSTAFNALTADLATGLSTAITKDGQTTVTANIPMSTYKFTGLGVGSAATDSANLSQVQSTVTKLLTSVSGADTITAVGAPVVAAYAAGQMFYFVAAGDNTGAVTLNIDSLGAKAVTRDGSVALAAGDIKSGEVVVVVYDGTRFQVVSQLNSAGDARFANVSIASSLYVGGVATIVGNAGFSANVSITSALSVGGAATITGATTVGGALTLSGGTANGVLYLNGSKMATSGSALTFDGTRMAIGTTPSATDTLLVYGSSAAAVVNVVGDGQSSNLNASRYSADTGSPFGIFYKARGTYASPAAVNTGDAAGQISFQVYGGSNFRDIARIAAITETYTSDTNISGYLSFRTNSGSTGSSEKMRLNAAGELGIGTSSWPSGQRLVVSGGDVNFGGQYLYLTNANADIALGAAQNSRIVNTDSTNTLAITRTGASSIITFNTAGSERMRLDSSGNIGIGTSSPGQKLHISTATTYQGILINGNQAPSVCFATSTNTTPAWKLGLSGNNASNFSVSTGASATDVLTLDASGNLGIGTSSPGSRVTVNDPGTGLSFTNATATSGFNIGLLAGTGSAQAYVFSRDNAALLFGTNNTERARIDSSGNLGIGTSSPGEKLEVNGAIKTAAPAGGTAASWKLGAVATVSPTSPNRTIEVDIGGTIYYLHAKTTNN